MLRMIPYADVDLESVRALSHPLRVRIMAILGDRALTAAEIADELDTDARTVADHARILERLGYMTSSPVSASRKGTLRYRLINSAHFTDQVWDRTPTTAKRDTVSAALDQLQTATAAALAEGGFDKADVHFTRTGLDLDAQGWETLSEEMLAWLARIDEIRQESAARLAKGAPRETHATATMMLFETAVSQQTHEGPAEQPAELFLEEEGLERAFQLSEQLEELLVRPNPPWTKVVALVDQLRVIARAVMVAKDAEQPPVEDR